MNAHNSFRNNFNAVSTTADNSITQELSAQRLLLQHHIRAMNHKMNLVQNENHMLKHMFVEGHKKNVLLQERLDLVLKAIFNMYANSNNSSSSSSQHQASQLMQQMYALFNSESSGGQFSVSDFNVGSTYQQLLLLQDGPSDENTFSFSPHDDIDTTPVNNNDTASDHTSTVHTPHPFDTVTSAMTDETQRAVEVDTSDPLALRRSDSLVEFAA
eukprot:gene723-959_t